MSGKSACQEIQENKDTLQAEIEKDKNGFGNFLNNLGNNMTAWMNPNSYQAENEAQSTVLKILRTSINSERATQITQSCIQGAANSQSNVIDNIQCPICNGGAIYNKDGTFSGAFLPAANIEIMKKNKDPCIIENIKQSNKSDVEQKCKLSSMLTDVMKSQQDAQAQAVVQVLQQATGLLSSNKSNNFSCDDIKTEITQKDYFDGISSCANSFTNNQENILQYCGKANNIIQENIIDSIQDCVIDNTVKKEMTGEQTVKTETDIKTDQEAEGLNLFASFASLGVFLIPIIIVIVMICSSSLASSAFFMFRASSSGGSGGSGGPGMYLN
jgi:hypothetical protein